VRRMTARQAFFRSSPDVRCRNHSLKKLIRFLHSAGRKSGLQNAELSPGLNPFLRFVFWGRALYNTVSIINDGESLNVQCIRSVDCPMFGHDFSRRLPKRHVRMARESCRHRGFVFSTLDFHTSIDSIFGGERVAAQSFPGSTLSAIEQRRPMNSSACRHAADVSVAGHDRQAW